MKFCVYAGTFDPFTNGHIDIVHQALKLFDQIFIIFGNNSTKQRKYDLEDMMSAAYSDIGSERVSVRSTDKLILDYISKFDWYNFSSTYLIRGIRNNMDYNYEENIAKINKEINPYINTLYFRANNDFISSSMVNELFKYGKDISKYVGENVLEVMNNAH